MFGVVYRRPNGNINLFMEELERILSDISVLEKTCLLFGDFNINLLNTDRSVRLYIDLLTSYGYVPCISKPTRVYKKSATIIDHIWTNNHEIISGGSGVLMTDVTDHFAPLICYKGKREKPKELSFS